MAGQETIGQITTRQRSRFNELWRGGRSEALSPDRIRYKVWRKYLVAPIVEVGAGDGLLARTFSSAQIVSVDQSIVGLRSAPDPRVVGTLECLPIRTGFARTIVAAEVLEHTGDPRAALLECRRIARPDAHLLLSVPMLPLAPAEALYHRLRIGEWPSAANLALWDPEHERRYHLDVLLAQLADAGWEPVERVPLFGSLTTSLMYFGESAAHKLVGRRLQLAHYGATLDRLWSRLDRHSDMAVICRLRLS
jgi:SAM-dependent methyltransferase